ncbi:DUF2326 domain-containing protein [Hymenobacter sp. BT186]|uniref:DUF2326 domain-containing protein n=1 Tax=Hymenobacter telluris TaxID=2816474 RepID=A0A939JCS7_9BACT|nr:ABC-three component system protein [Hymenobacter telluris]MBO0360506.1 DUF2326 domain-containing protein [Hymenobacter telluris]MBW3376533.1 DUF2326 domain-containing protein [Hymenobacter norwichensis]
MIYSIFSSLPSFKSYAFRSGLNIIIADKGEASGAGQTRNKAGKSSIVLLIHFALGKEGDPSSLFRKPELKDHNFGIEFDLRGVRIRATRSGATFGKVHLTQVDASKAVKDWAVDALDGDWEATVSSAKWESDLGRIIFQLPEKSEKFGPKFGMLFNYFARRASSGAFLNPQQQSSKQSPADTRVALSYLLGLDWRISTEREQLRQSAENTKKLQKAAQDGLLEGLTGDPKQLLTQSVLVQEDVNRMTEAVRSFRMLPDYAEREKEANNLTREINRLADENAQDGLYIHDLEVSLSSESAPQLDDVQRMYSEAGVSLPGIALQRFEEVRKFHESVVRNRKMYLEEELTQARLNVENRQRKMTQLDDRRTEVMTLLKTHGALQHYSKLQSELSRAEARAEQIKQQQSILHEVAERVAQFKIDQQRLYLRLQRDFIENEQLLKDAILAFEEASRALYENAGNLNIYPSETGPNFEVTIQGMKSQGVNNAQIFCFDMMLMRMATRRGISPGFLIHDSSLFDPIDERQKERALEYGAKLAEQIGFQYIVTLNSDQIPKERVTTFPLEDYIIPPRLTDEPGGGLFGFEFN